ncbi:MAG: rRNA pseudouridine synthase [Deltaproteobacteria bacterium]|nr:rRNA pseudouridine synthase [Deltaproteobacteria bacterium]
MPRRTPERTLVIAYHKPRGLITTHVDELGRETVYDRMRARLPPELARVDWHAIGRLDADTTGLLLFTNDGALVHHATQPATHLVKVYRALVKGLLDEPTLARLRAGVPLTGGLGTSAPAQVELVEHQRATSWLVIRIAEGRNRQVRRMLLAVGSQVIRLERTHVGGVALDLPEDGWRALTDDEVRRGLGYAPRTLVRRSKGQAH